MLILADTTLTDVLLAVLIAVSTIVGTVVSGILISIGKRLGKLERDVAVITVKLNAQAEADCENTKAIAAHAHSLGVLRKKLWRMRNVLRRMIERLNGPQSGGPSEVPG